MPGADSLIAEALASIEKLEDDSDGVTIDVPVVAGGEEADGPEETNAEDHGGDHSIEVEFEEPGLLGVEAQTAEGEEQEEGAEEFWGAGETDAGDAEVDGSPVAEAQPELAAGEDAEVPASEESRALIEDLERRLTEAEGKLETAQELQGKAEADAKEHYDRLLRVSAEFDNTRKRIAREKAEMSRYAAQPAFRDVLQVLDNLERAFQHAGDKPDDLVSFKEGVEMVVKQLVGILEKFGVKGFEAEGLPFDFNVHEAIGVQPSEDVEPNTVLEVYQRGYMFHERLLRPARVVVSQPPHKPPPPPPPPPGADEESTDPDLDATAVQAELAGVDGTDRSSEAVAEETVGEELEVTAEEGAEAVETDEVGEPVVAEGAPEEDADPKEEAGGESGGQEEGEVGTGEQEAEIEGVEVDDSEEVEEVEFEEPEMRESGGSDPAAAGDEGDEGDGEAALDEDGGGTQGGEGEGDSAEAPPSAEGGAEGGGEAGKKEEAEAGKGNG